MLLPFMMGALLAVAAPAGLESARDRQDRAALEKLAAAAAAAAAKAPNDAGAYYRAALAYSYQAEVALEVHDKRLAQQAAEQGIHHAEKAIALNGNVAEHYRVLGTLCGQVIPANVLAGVGYGKRAKDAINAALQKDPKSSLAYVARGVGNYYLPPAFGGGMGLAIADFRKAIELDSHNAEAFLWLGLSLRKEQKNAEARAAFTQSLALDPNRIWTRQQLEKTPAK